jgi:peptide deformylase
MTIRPIVRYPDSRLALPAQPVTVFDDALRDLARDLLETMHAAPGIGITAPHIGVSLRVVVLDLGPSLARGPMSIPRSSGPHPK